MEFSIIVFIPDILPSLNRIFEAISMEDEKKEEKTQMWLTTQFCCIETSNIKDA